MSTKRKASGEDNAASKRARGPTNKSKLATNIADDDARLEGLNDVTKAKLRAAYAAVDENIEGVETVGIGSGSTVVFAAQRLGEIAKTGRVFQCVPTSFQAQQLIHENGLRLSNLEDTPKLDIAIDGADEVDEDMNCIKGGGGCLTQEKIVAFNAKKFVIVADESKMATRLGTKWRKGVPVEVIPMAYIPIMGTLKDMGGKPVLRMAKAKMGPVVTDNGNFILDVDFGALEKDFSPELLAERVSIIPGVVEHGLFVQMAEASYFGLKDGSVEKHVHT